MATKSTPRWLKKLCIGVITGILLGIIGFMAGASWLTWGLLYAPLLSLTNKAFWAKAWKALGAKDGESSSSSSYQSNNDEDYYYQGYDGVYSSEVLANSSYVNQNNNDD